MAPPPQKKNNNIFLFHRDRSSFISWGVGGGGLGNFSGDTKNILPQIGDGGGAGDQNLIYESMGRGGGGHKYDFHFLFWHENALASDPLSYHLFS